MAERSTSQMVGATLVGGMIGAGLALLLAPRSGKETREKIHDNYDQMKDKASEKLQHAKSRLHRGAAQAQEFTDDLADAVQSTGKKARSEMEELKSTPAKRRQSPVLSAWEEEV